MAEDKAVDTSSCCASCGIAAVDDIKLKECDNCDLVRYCSDECERDHRPKHLRACRGRVAELREELLFKQPEASHLGDCPICMLPMPLDFEKCGMTPCCSKVICLGCVIAHQMRLTETSMDRICPFCREPTLYVTEEQRDKRMMKRVDPVAIRYQGVKQYKAGDHKRAVEYFTKAAELGDAPSHFKLATMHIDGDGVEKDDRKYIHHLEEAAIGGHPDARYFLGKKELENGNTDTAAKHYIIAAGQGDDDSTKMLMDMFKGGFVIKEVLADTLRSHQAAVDATKSKLRETADEYVRLMKERGYD